MTTSADLEVLAAGRDALRRGLEHLHYSPPRKVFLVFDKPDPYSLPRQAKWHEHRAPIVQPTQCIAAISECGQSDLEIAGRH